MKVTKLVYPLLIALTQLVACERNPELITLPEVKPPAEAVAVGFTMQSFSASVTPDPSTKAADTSLPAGETVRLVIYKTGSTADDDYCGQNTYLVEAGNGTRTLVPCTVDFKGQVTGSGEEMRLVPGKQYDIYAYSPATEVRTSLAGNKGAFVNDGDLLASKTTITLASYSPSVNIASLQHKLAKVAVTVVKDPSDDGLVTLTGEKITLPGVDSRSLGSPIYAFGKDTFEDTLLPESHATATDVELKSFVQTRDDSFSAETILLPQTGSKTFPINLEVKIDGQIYTFATPNTTVTFESGKKYSWKIYCKRKGVTLSPMSVEPWDEYETLLDAGVPVPLQKAANTYMVAPGDGIAIPMKHVGGQTFSFVSDIASVELIWQTKDAAENMPVTGAGKLRWNATKKQVEVRTNPLVPAGNAVIAVKNAAGTILWSWLVWVTPYDPSEALNGSVKAPKSAVLGVKSGEAHVYGGDFQIANGRQSVIMDRNLGDLHTLPSEVQTPDTDCGCYFQGGRKDPFPGRESMCRIDGETYHLPPVTTAPSTWNESTPTTFYSDFNHTSWTPVNVSTTPASGEKSVTDPCPYGWRVPLTQTWSDFTNNTFLTDYISSCYHFGSNSSFYYYDGWMNGSLWSSDGRNLGKLWALDILSAYVGFEFEPMNVSMNTSAERQHAYQVRCVQDATIYQLGMPRFSEVTFSEITATSVRLNARMLSDGGASIQEIGFAWSYTPDTHATTRGAASVEADGSFMYPLRNLTAGTALFIFPYAELTNGQIVYGDYSRVIPQGAPVLTTDAVNNITFRSATASATVTTFGGSTGHGRGICYSTVQGFNPQTQGTQIADANGSATGSFSIPLTNLSPGTTYYVKAYARNSATTVYGMQRTFVTPSAPTLSQPVINSRTADSFTVSAQVIRGRETITSCGFEWSADANFASGVGSSPASNTPANFSSTISGLSTGSGMYYVRAWAESALGRVYGGSVSVRLLQKPTVVSSGFISFIGDKVTLTGRIESTGDQGIIDRGFEYSKDENFASGTVTKVSLGGGVEGTFTGTLSGLEYLTDYYTRAYATTMGGTGYGAVLPFISAHNMRGAEMVKQNIRKSSFQCLWSGPLRTEGITGLIIAYAPYNFAFDSRNQDPLKATRVATTGSLPGLMTTAVCDVEIDRRYCMWVVLVDKYGNHLYARDQSEEITYTNRFLWKDIWYEIDMQSNEGNEAWANGFNVAVIDWDAVTTENGWENTLSLVGMTFKMESFYAPSGQYCWQVRSNDYTNPSDFIIENRDKHWFLPSADQFAAMQAALAAENNNFPPGLYDLRPDTYWTSEATILFKSVTYSGSGGRGSAFPQKKYRVRCIKRAN